MRSVAPAAGERRGLAGERRGGAGPGAQRELRVAVAGGGEHLVAEGRPQKKFEIFLLPTGFSSRRVVEHVSEMRFPSDAGWQGEEEEN